jgi:hypothetical protein
VVNPEGAEPDEAPSISMDEILAESSPFSVYDDLKRKLMERGIPADQIRFIHEAGTDAQKARLFDEVNQGRVRVLMGSTAKMGAGANVQRRLVALHHLDAPWKPSDLEQREGRIIRQGNMFHERDPEGFEVEIIRYATEKTYDARMWQTIQGKAEGIEQFRKGDLDARIIEDVAGEAANAAEMKAAATGNELIFTQVKLAAELKKLEGIHASFQRGRHQLESRVSYLEKAPERTAIEICAWKQEIALRDANTTKEPCFAAAGRIYGPKERGTLLEVVRKAMKIAVESHAPTQVGQYRGFKVSVAQALSGECQFTLTGKSGAYSPDTLKYGHGGTVPMGGLFQRMDNYMARFEDFIQDLEQSAQRQAQELTAAKKSQGRPFPQQERLEALRRDNREVLRELRLSQKDPSYKSAWKPSTPDMAGEQSNTAAKSPNAATPPQKTADPAVRYIQVGDRGSFPIFNDRFLNR